MIIPYSAQKKLFSKDKHFSWKVAFCCWWRVTSAIQYLCCECDFIFIDIFSLLDSSKPLSKQASPAENKSIFQDVLQRSFGFWPNLQLHYCVQRLTLHLSSPGSECVFFLGYVNDYFLFFRGVLFVAELPSPGPLANRFVLSAGRPL